MRKHYKKTILLFLFTLFAVLFSATNVFAAGGDLFTVADDIIRDVYMHIAGISTVLAGLMSAIAVIGAKMSNNQHRVDQSWDWLKRVWMAWAVINGIGAFISYITPLFNGYAQLPYQVKEILLRLAGSSRADSPHNGGTAEKRSWERQQICRYRSGAKPAAENQPPPQERRIHRRNDFPRPQPPQRLADQHNFLSRRAFCSVPAQTCGNVHFGGLSCRRDCA